MSSDSRHARAADVRPGDVFAEKYKIRKQLATSTHSTTFQADDQTGSRQVALKVIRADAFRNNLDAATAYRLDLNSMRQITHEAIVRIFEFGEYAGYLFVAMELLDGQSLSQFLERSGKLGTTDFFSIFCPLCDAVAQLHARKIVHGDVRPDNVFVLKDGSVKLLDFGIERNLKNSSKSSSGLPGVEYMAPERTAGGALTSFSDIYSVGAVCYTMLTGKHPGNYSRAPQNDHWAGFESLRKELRGSTPGLAGFLEVALRFEPGKRYKSINAMLASGCAIRDANTAQPSRMRLAGLLRNEPSPVDPCIQVFLKTIGRVREMHAAGESHAELSPQKIWLQDGKVEIERAQPATGGATLLIPDARYSAPELLMAQTALDESSHNAADIYVLGFVLYELLAGRQKMDEQFKDKNQAGSGLGWMRWHVDADQKLLPLGKVLPDCPEPLAELVDRMVDKDASKRIRSFEEIEAKLSTLHARLHQTDQFVPEVKPSVAPAQPKKPVRSRSPWSVALATIIVLALFGAGGWWVCQQPVGQQVVSMLVSKWRAIRAPKRTTVAGVASTPLRATTPLATSVPTAVLQTATGPMMLVPAGPFVMGEDTVPSEAPAHKVDVAAFYLDRVEVSNREYRSFCRRSGRSVPPNPAWDAAYVSKDNYPAVNVSWENAKAFCEWSGKRLPSEAEWEKAARGTDPFIHWANWTMPGVSNLAGAQGNRPAPVGSFAADVSPYGVLDLAGNVQEWVSDTYKPYGNAAGQNNIQDGRKLIRGGSFATSPESLSPAWRGWVAEGSGPAESASVGFRCAVDAAAAGQVH